MGDNKHKLTPSANFKRFSTLNTFRRAGTLNSTFRSDVFESTSTSDDVLSDSSLDLECDFAYSSYLRTIITNEMIEEKIAKNIEDMFDQLSQQMEVLQDLEDKKFNLEKEIKSLEVKMEVKEVYNNLNNIYCEVTKMLEDYNVNNNLTECIKVGETSAYNKLYLKNVKPLENSDEYDKFLSVIKKCVDSLKKLELVTCNSAEIQLLRDNVKQYHDLQAQFTSKRQLLMERQSDFTLNAFKTLSDKLVVIHQ